jgi:hypothetical protein
MDSPFVLRNLVFCTDCGEKLKTKNQTSAKSKKDESIYFCPSCKCKIRIGSIHQKVINDFSLRWARELKSHKNIFKRTSNNWKKLCSKEIQSLTTDIENLRYKMGVINPNNENYDEFREAIELQLKSKEQNKSIYINVLSQIDLLLEDKMTTELIDRFKQDIHYYNTETGSFQDPRNVLRVMKRISKAANVTSIRFHDIRHTHASILISQGVDIVKVSARLGHANPKITLETYAHLIPNADNELADIFQKAVEKSREQNVSKE